VSRRSRRSAARRRPEPALVADAAAPASSTGIARVFVGVLAAVQVAVVAQFVVVSLARMTYPFELEWLEGLTIDNAWRLLHGLPIYGPPDASFAANFYPPLQYVAALPFLVTTGWSLAGARLLSWLAVVGSGVIAARVVRRAGGSWIAVLLALGIMASFYPATHYWYDLARVDALETFFVVAGVAVLVSPHAEPDRGRLLASAVLLTAATLTKQTAVPLGLAAAAAFALVGDWKRAWRLAALLAIIGGASGLALWIWSRGWISLIYTVPRHHRVAARRLADFASFAYPLSPLLVVATVGSLRMKTTRVVLVVTLAALAVGAVAFCKVGGDANSSIPAVFLLATAAGMASDEVWRRLETSFLRLAAVVVLGVIPVSTGALSTDVLRWIPSATDRRQAQALWEDMRGTEGDFLPYGYSFVSTVLRGRTWAVGDRLYDFAGGYDEATFRTPDVDRYPAYLFEAITARDFTAIYTNGGGIPNDPVDDLIAEHYRIVRSFGPADLGPSVTRWRKCTPRVKWVPKRDAS
jgi:hypothetical protein